VTLSVVPTRAAAVAGTDDVVPAPGRAARVPVVPATWTTVAVERRGSRTGCDLRRGALSPHLLEDDGRVVRVALVGAQALLLGGDHVGIRVRVGAGAVLELVETSGTVAYDGRGSAARWTVDVVVAAGGVLVWDGLPLVVATGADVRRSTSVRLGRGAVACLRETVVLGRAGERGGRLRTALRVEDDDGPVLAEDLRLDGSHPEPGVLGGHRVADSVVLVGRRPVWRPAPGRGPAHTHLDLDQPGAVARSLGHEAHRVVLTELAAAWCREAQDAAGARGASAPTTRDGGPTVTGRRRRGPGDDRSAPAAES
jgi:urease accessory protein